MGVVIEEADETLFWLELLSEAGIVKTDRLEALAREANELVAVFVASRKTATGTNNPDRASDDQGD
jgi:four helix bundle protein